MPQEILDTAGAVSEETVTAMVQGALRNSYSQLAVATSGVAGPDGGSLLKPVGTVWFAWGSADGSIACTMEQFHGDRIQIRQQAAQFALEGLLDLVELFRHNFLLHLYRFDKAKDDDRIVEFTTSIRGPKWQLQQTIDKKH